MRFQTIVAPTITELFERQIQGMILSSRWEMLSPTQLSFK